MLNRIRRFALAIRKPLRVIRKPRTVASDGGLEKVIADLSGLAAATEDDFLRIGRQLEEIVARAQQQHRQIANLVDAVASKTGANLAGVFAEIGEWVGDAGTDAGPAADGAHWLTDLAPVVRAVRGPLHELSNAVRTLRFIGVVTRVESARLGSQGAGFDALASDVIGLGESIDEKSLAIWEAVKGVEELLACTGKSMADNASRQRAEMRTLTAECTAGLDQLQQDEERLAEITRFTQARYEAFAAGIGNIVAGLQSHDSARQGIEHVVETLREARGGGHDEAPGRSSSGQVVELEIVQLTRTQTTFQAALEGMLSDLSELGQTIEECARRARELLTSRAGSGEGWMAKLEKRLRTLASTVSELAASRQTAARAAAEVQEACGRISGFITEIEQLGERMLRLALNAEIQAVHLAETGVVMESVAEGIRRTSESASEGARAAGQALREVEKASGAANPGRSRLLAGAPPGKAAAGMIARPTVGFTDACPTAATQLSERVRSLAAGLKSADAQSLQHASDLASGAEALCAEISALRSGITAGRRFDEVAGSCLDMLREIAAAAASSQAPPDASTDAVVAGAAHKYTMHAEREAHDRFVGLEPGVDPVPAVTPSQDASEFGDNVELF